VRLGSYASGANSRVGLVHRDTLIDLQHAYRLALVDQSLSESEAASLAALTCPPDMVRLIELGTVGLAAAREALAFVEGVPGDDLAAIPLEEVAWLPPVTRPAKIFCIWANDEQLLKTTRSRPDHPLYFQKPTNALVGHRRAIEIPDIGAVHMEPELAVVIGKRAKHVSADAALDYVFGYSIIDDVTAVDVRAVDVLKIGIPMTDKQTNEVTTEELTLTPIARHKGIDTFAPMGPWVVTKDEIPDPHNLTVRAWLGEDLTFSGSTSSFLYSIPAVIEWITKWATLLPGDVIAMGTTAATEDWPIRDGDLSLYGGSTRIEIEQIGALENSVVRV
jgi:2-keto-4-pentenoate hydratase/2-oxohepta-3-ene-1,7-dioic acid hydratase in catechol pathway